MKRSIYFIFLVLAYSSASACITCNKEIQEGIYNSMFFPNLFTMLSAFIVLALIVALLSYFALRKSPLTQQRLYPKVAAAVPLGAAAMVIGIGAGGFLEGITLHQILQLHEVLSNKIDPRTYTGKSINMFWDGIFHAFTLAVTLTGAVLMWRLLKKEGINRSGYLFSGGLVFGWGLFNLVEGVIDHHILKLHNVNEFSPDPNSWNWGFTFLAILCLITGLLLIRRSIRQATI